MITDVESNFSAFKAFICALTFTCILNVGHPQAIVPQKPVINIPTSPEAALLGRFGDIPIGYYTGTANIAIPLYSIREGNIEIPLSLNYHGSGIKVEDQATWVGLGWDLSPEGAIIQEVRGKSDEYDYLRLDDCDNYSYFKQRVTPLESGLDYPYMFLHQWGRSTAQDNCINGSYPIPYPLPPLPQDYFESYCLMDRLLRGYGQPDIYQYNFGGYSGKFYINPQTHQVVLIDRDRQIYFSIINSSTIEATTLDGTVWHFGVTESADGGPEFEYTGKTFKLDRITTLSGRTIEFTFTDNSCVERVLNQSAEITIFSGYPISETYTFTNHHKKTLTRITTSDTYIDFNTSSREDINVFPGDNMQKLSSIDITARSSNKKIKTIQFNYSYFPYDFTGSPIDAFVTAHADALGKRLRLDSLRELGYTDDQIVVATKPAYKFEYDLSTTMPLKTSFAKDFWGYYNAEPNTTLLPNLDYFDYFYKPEYQSINNLPLSYPYTGANRYSNNTKAGAYLIKKITYPTGGFTQFEYEPNSFTNQFIPDKTSNIFKSYDVQDNSLGGTTSTLFKLSKATTIHFDNHINNGTGNYNGVTPLTYSQMSGCYIRLSKVKMVDGSPVVTLIKQWDLSTVTNQEFDNNGGKNWIEDLRVEYDPDPNPTFNYLLQVMFPDELNNPLFASIAGVTSHITFYDDTGVDITVSKQGGMRIKSIKNYTSEGVLASDKLIKYYEGKLLNKFRPLTVYKANNLNVRGVQNGNAFEYIAFYNKITVSGNNFGVEGGNPIGYGKVEEIELSQGNENHGKKVFNYLNTENKTGQGCPTTPDLKNGLISKEEIFNNVNDKLTEKNYSYTSLTPTIPYYVCVNTVHLSTGSLVPCANLYDPTPYTIQYYQSDYKYIGSEYGFNAYTIKSEWNKLQTVNTTQYSNGNALTVVETYAYNSEGSIRSLTTTNSKGESLITKYYYPNDYLTDPSADSYLTTVHNTGTPVITENYKASVLLSKQKTIYGSFPGVTTKLPQYTYIQIGNNPEEKRMTINSYDEKGNITQYTEENNIPISFVWNADKTLPIAKIENATYASLLALPGGLNADFRASLPNARVTTFTYKPLIGVATITDVNNRTMYYEYDAYGRLMWIKDKDGRVVRTMDYHYRQ